MTWGRWRRHGATGPLLRRRPRDRQIPLIPTPRPRQWRGGRVGRKNAFWQYSYFTTSEEIGGVQNRYEGNYLYVKI